LIQHQWMVCPGVVELQALLVCNGVLRSLTCAAGEARVYVHFYDAGFSLSSEI